MLVYMHNKKGIAVAAASAAAITALLMYRKPIPPAQLKPCIVNVTSEVKENTSLPEKPTGLLSQFLLEMDQIRKAFYDVEKKDGDNESCAAFSHVLIETVRHWKASSKTMDFETYLKTVIKLSEDELRDFIAAAVKCKDYANDVAPEEEF